MKPNGQINKHDHDVPENMYKPENEREPGWIDRDRLIRIEQEELESIGIKTSSARRTTSKTGRKSQSHERQTTDKRPNEQPDQWPLQTMKTQPRSPPVEEVEEEEEQEREEDRSNWDLRTPEEIAEDNSRATQIYTNPTLRKSGSRIPVLAASSIPISSDRVGRETPQSRKRGASGTGEDGGIAYPKTRARAGSAGSQHLLDTAEQANDSPRAASKTGSPTKMKPIATPSPQHATAMRKVTPASGVRKPSANTHKPRTPSTSNTNSPSQARPSTRSGTNPDRPRTAVNRPEGDPPWLATMNKPDPMLPPDQQIIPTHARRQQQNQWNEEGAVPKTYARDFSPLALHTADGLVKQPSPPLATENKNPLEHLSPAEEKRDSLRSNEKDENAWPLKPMPSVRSTSTGRPGTSGSIGGYSTMPKVVSSPPTTQLQSPRISNNPSINQGQRIQQLPIPPDDLGKKEKSCGCCIVM